MRRRAGQRNLLHETLLLCLRDQRLVPSAFRDAMQAFGPLLLRNQLAQHPVCSEGKVICK